MVSRKWEASCQENAIHQVVTLSIWFFWGFGLLVCQPFLLLVSFFILCQLLLSFFRLFSIIFIFSPVSSCFWSLFWCLILDVCGFSASSAGLSLSVRQIFCPSSFFTYYLVSSIVSHLRGVVPSFVLMSVPFCSRFFVFVMCRFAEFVSFTSSARLFFGPPPQQFCLVWSTQLGTRLLTSLEPWIGMTNINTGNP